MLQIKRRSVLELDFETREEYDNPFLDMELDCRFASPSGKEYLVPCFCDGEHRWKVRFSPNEIGVWSYETSTNVADRSLESVDRFEVTEPDEPVRGFLKTCPGRYWGLQYESGEPCFILGDTMYNLFGVAYCGLDVESVLRRRAQQGLNLIRARLQVSPYHPPEGYSEWQTRPTWPWGGSPQKPQFDRFNLEYFQVVDRVMRLAEDLGIGFEMIMEAWGFEYPFNQRGVFIPEYEELWMRYLVARYDAFSSIYVWTLMNEYEYYPNGDWHYNPEADLWAVRTGRFVKRIAPHGHPVAIHNGPREPSFARRFKRAPGVIDLIMFQTWGTTGEKDSWLAAGIEDSIASSLKDWKGAFILAEYGYERNPDLKLKVPGHRYMNPEHTRRGAWRGAFSGTGVIHGFENTWGPWWIPGRDQEGMKYLVILKEFFTNTVEFHRFKPETEIIDQSEQHEPGTRPLCLSTSEKDAFLVYLPAGGNVSLNLSKASDFESFWFNPRTGGVKEASKTVKKEITRFTRDGKNDWVLILREKR
ncbi:MAG: DUF4038 domain-containing protein [Candidatus Bathyarchaeota archaeon]|nr:DUF4038 domain-containing protein [Candidatus Bathyarchaeota archaeon]